jgi:hypothetical protein
MHRSSSRAWWSPRTGLTVTEYASKTLAVDPALGRATDRTSTKTDHDEFDMVKLEMYQDQVFLLHPEG